MIINTKLLLAAGVALLGIAAGVHFYCAREAARATVAAVERHEATVKQPPPQKWAATIKNY